MTGQDRAQTRPRAQVRLRTRIRLQPGFFLMLAAAYFFDRAGILWCVLPAAALHELGHALAVWGMRGRIRALTLSALGGRIDYWAPPSYRAERLIALSGALLNGAAALGCAAASALGGPGWFEYCAGVNLLLGGVNLLPVRPLDGGQFLYALLAPWRGEEAAARVLRILGWIFCAGFLLCGLYIAWKTRYNISMLCLGVFLTVQTLATPHKG